MNRARQFFWQALQGLNLAKPKKKHRLEVMVDEFLERWNKFPSPRRIAPDQGGIGIVISPWLQSAVPLFSLECARQLAAIGQPVTVIWDATDIFGSASNSWEVTQLERVIARVRGEFTVLSPPAMGEELREGPSFFEELLAEGAVQKVRGETGARELLRDNPSLADALRKHIGRVKSLLEQRRFDWLLLPGGVWAVSGSYAYVASQLGISTTTFDCGPGVLCLGHDSAAAHYGDVGVVAERLIRETKNRPEERRWMMEVAKQRLDIRMRGVDEYRLQPVVAATAPPSAWDILILLNLRWDTAALCRRKLFDDVTDWLSQVLAWVEAHPSATVAIRQHPCEKLPDFRGNDDFGKLLANYPRLAGRAVYLSAEETVNTYDLIAGSKVTLPFTSRVGVESAIFRKPAVLSAKCYYAGCGFAWNPSTREEYFDLIAQALGGKLTISEEAREAALITYFLAECCLELRTHFTPAPTDYAQWVHTPPAQLWESQENQDLLTALVTREPAVSIRHRRLVEAAAKELENTPVAKS